MNVDLSDDYTVSLINELLSFYNILYFIYIYLFIVFYVKFHFLWNQIKTRFWANSSVRDPNQKLCLFLRNSKKQQNMA